MHRASILEKLSENSIWDILIIGGGATGLGAALDAASRGYKTLLVEQHDFAKGTSSRSTKLVHGGVRYLAQGNIKLVKEALRERGWLLKNAPHLTAVQPFIIPVYSWWRKWYYFIGLRLYDLLAGKLSLGKTSMLTATETITYLPSLTNKKLKGGVWYVDGQFDDSRLCSDLAYSAQLHGALVVNYCRADALIKEGKKIVAVKVVLDEGEEYIIRTKSVINATGVFTDAVLKMDSPEAESLVVPSQGIHLVVNQSHFSGTHAMMIPETDDGRVLFAVPWKNKIILGTTDTLVDDIVAEPRPLEEEIDFILEHINRYTVQPITRKDITSHFAGLRPLVRSGSGISTALLSRDHTLLVSAGGMVTITGGKWTTYRKMAQDAVDNAVFVSRLDKRLCVTKHLPIGDPLAVAANKKKLLDQEPELSQLLHPSYTYTLADVAYAVHFEMALTLEDVLARRTRLLFLDAAAALTAAPIAVSCMRKALGQSIEWEQAQLMAFRQLVEQYLPALSPTIES